MSGKTESFCGCPCSEVNVSLDEAKAGIEMLVFPENGGLSYHFTCLKNLYTEDFIRNFASVYDHVLTEFTRKKNLNDAEFLDAEAESLLDKANDTVADYDKSDMLEAMIINSEHVYHDMATHVPSFFNGPATYFKPNMVPAESSGEARKYWEMMMTFQAGNYERFCSRELFRIIQTPHEHDLMIDDSLKNIALTQREKLWVKDSLLRFYVVWTRKESLIKCEGSGFISEPNEIDSLPENNFDDPVLYEGKYYRIDSFMISMLYHLP